MMRILFLTHYFPPEVNAPANRTFEHCREWVRQGHEVHVVTCIPSHPHGRPFAGYRKSWYRRERIEGVEVHRVWTLLAANRGVVKRTLGYLSFVPNALWRALRLGRFDVIIATSPQFFVALAGWLVASARRTPWIFELRDLWPESIGAVAAVRAPLALRLLERLELHLYERSERVVCLTRAFMRDLERRGVDGHKLHYVPNGVDPQAWSGGDGARARAELGLEERHVIASYIGTVGMAHGIGTVLEAARLLRDAQPDVRFLVVGDGAELDELRRTQAREGLDNLLFTGLVARERVRDLMAATDIALVLLRDTPTFRTVLPSKLFEAMGAGRPVVLGVEGEARETLEQAGAGLAIPPEDGNALARAVAALAGSPTVRRQMGRAGRDFVAREFDRSRWAAAFLEIIERAVPPGRQPTAELRA